MKKILIICIKQCNNNSKTLLKMKLTLLLLMAFVIEVSATVYSQSVKFNFDIKNEKVADVLEKIESSSNFRFFYQREQVDVNRMVDLTASDNTVEELLNMLFDKQDIGYKVMEDNLVLLLSDETLKKEILEQQQQNRITGTVTDKNGAPVPGANVIVTGTAQGTITDIAGKYSIEVPQEATSLTFTFVGMEPKEVAIGTLTQIDVTMAESSFGLDEVVVIGYGTQTRKDITGSISSVKATSLEKRSIASVTQGLQGLVPGLNIAERNASPGQLGAITIRGASSITAGTDPLWVVDGFPTDQRNAASLNPSDIESVEVLKDASATAIFGSRGSNGVILVTTKSGKSGAAQFDVNVSGGVSSVPSSFRVEQLNAQEYVQYYTEKNGGVLPPSLSYWDGKTDTDWQDLIYQNAVYQNYNISAHGGSDKINYLISANYIDHEGVIIGEGEKKYSTLLKVDYHASKRVKFGLNVAPNLTQIKRSSPYSDWSSLQAQATLLPPTLPVKRTDGTYAYAGDVSGMYPIGNPLETAETYRQTYELFRMLAGLNLSIEILKGLTFRSDFSTNLGSDKSKLLYNAPGPRFDLPSTSRLTVSQGQQFNWLNENTLTYKKTWAKHSFDIVGGVTAQKNHNESVTGSVSELQILGPEVLSIGNSSTLTASNGISENSIVSLLGRFNYSFNDKYLLTGTVRRDGSSRFGINNRYKTFYAFALGWRLSEENFIKNLGFVDNAKVRLSYGTTGSNDITDYVSRASYFPTNQSFGGTPVTGIRQGDPGNPDLTWEFSEKLDAGIDLTLFNGVFTLIFDYYDNTTTGLILSRNIVPSSGYGGYLKNIGSMRNWGFELSPAFRIINQKDFTWSLGGNVTHNNQEILDLGGDSEIFNFFGALRRVVGGELQQMRGTKNIGIAREGQSYPAQPTIKPGEVVYEDYDKNGSIGNFLSGDGQLYGDTNLDWVYGINTNLSYKNLSLSALITGQQGAFVYDFIQIQVSAPIQPLVNISKEFWYDGRYVSESQPGNGKTPSAAAAGSDGILPVSLFGVQKTDFLRIRNITLSYTIPEPVLKKIGNIKNVTAFTTVENLFTWTKFIGNNPEGRRTSAGGPSLIGGSQLSGVGDGLEVGLTSPQSVPVPRIWTLGLNFAF